MPYPLTRTANEVDVADAYMTLVGYFNSLRELGGVLRLLDDDGRLAYAY